MATSHIQPVSGHSPSIDRQIRANGQTIRAVVNSGTEPDLPPLLLMNGIGARLELLEPLVDCLSGRRDIIRFDVPGVGGSPIPSRPYRFWQLARNLGAVLDELGYENRKVDTLGISWGGGLAQQFAWTQASRCRRLILVSTAAGAIMVPAHPRVLSKMITHKRYRDPGYLESVAAELYGGTMRRGPDVASNALRSTNEQHSARGYLLQLAAGLGWTSAVFLPLLRQRTLVLSGDDDPLIPKANAFILGGLIRQSQVNIFNGGHLHLITEAPEMAPIIEEFLDQPPARNRHPNMPFME